MYVSIVARFRCASRCQSHRRRPSILPPTAPHLVSCFANPSNVVVRDGDFATPDLEDQAVLTFVKGQRIGNGFTVTDGNVDLVRTDLGGVNHFPVHGGDQSLDLNGDTPGTIAKAINTTTGDHYTVVFYLAGNPDGAPFAKPLLVSATPGGLSSTQPAIASAQYTAFSGEVGFVQATLSFIAQGAETTVTFASKTANSPYGPVLADVSMRDLGRRPC